MADETKRPTAQDIENADNAVRLLLGSLVTGALKNPATRAENTMAAIRTWAPVLDVIAYAADCLRAEEEAERVPGSIVEYYGVGPEDGGPPRRGDVWYCWDGLMAAVVIKVRESGGWNVTISGRDGIVEWSPESVAAVQGSPTWERVQRGPPEVEAPEEADEYPCAAGCGEMLGTPFAPGDTCWSCDAAEQSAPEDAGELLARIAAAEQATWRWVLHAPTGVAVLTDSTSPKPSRNYSIAEIHPDGAWNVYRVDDRKRLTVGNDAPSQSAAAAVILYILRERHPTVRWPAWSGWPSPEDAGDDGWIDWPGWAPLIAKSAAIEVEDKTGGIHWCAPGALVFVMMKAGIAMADIVRYRLARPPQPPTDPESRVRAMSDEEVADALVGLGVDRYWSRVARASEGQRRLYYTAGHCDEAVSESGYCWTPEPNTRKFSDVTGDTSTPEGRAECSRRLLVHLLRAGVERG